MEDLDSALTYRVELEPSLRAMHVSMCSEGRLPARFRAIHRVGAERFVHADVEHRDGSRQALPGPILDLRSRDDWAEVRCVHYEVQLVSGGADPEAPIGFTDAVYAPTSSWLWGPEPRSDDARYRMELALPEGMQASAFFPRDEDGVMSFGEAGFDFVTYAAFGHLDIIDVPAPGGCIQVAAIGGGPSHEAITAWMTSASDAASRSLGRLPTDTVSVVALPIGARTRDGGDPLAFGMAAHGERGSLLAFMWSDASEEALRGDWVAVHELTHLGHAFLGGESAWLTEGIATYYENVLRARAGGVTPAQALSRLDGGFLRGERGGTGRTLREESEASRRTGAFARVYWAGAAIALLIDVALRAEGSSLDEAMARAYALHRGASTDRELLLAMDGGTAGTASRIGLAWADSSAFPDLSEAYRALGLTRTDDGGIAWTEEGQDLRNAVLNASPVLASNPPTCRL
jgi:hypothetical protein